jgi:RNA polymerase-binding transcription factor DksA
MKPTNMIVSFLFGRRRIRAEGNMLRVREMLIKRRREIFEGPGRFESDWQALAERDIELEEEAQKGDLTILFDGSDGREKNQIEETDLTFCRMAVGKYRIRESCEKVIYLKWIEALHRARLC